MTGSVTTAETGLIALQLYTLRGQAELDLLQTISEVAALGYDGVELAGLHGLDPAEVARTCRELGLEICGAHVGVERFEDEPDAVATELRSLDLRTIVFPSLPTSSPEDGDSAIGRLHAAATRALDLGLTPVFHNHDVELRRAADGARPWEEIVALPELRLELDLGWAWVAGESPAELLETFAGRVPLVHVKDHVRTAGGAPDCPVGEGEVGYDAVVPVALATGVRWLVVEQDEAGNDPLDAVARSLTALRAILARTA